MEISILLFEKNDRLRETLIRLLDNQSGMRVAAASGHGSETERLFKEVAPDLAIVDVHLRDFDVAETFRRMSSESPNAKIMAFSNHTSRRFVEKVLKAGASGYLLKDSAFEELVTAVRTVSREEIYVSPRIGRGVSPRQPVL